MWRLEKILVNGMHVDIGGELQLINKDRFEEVQYCRNGILNPSKTVCCGGSCDGVCIQDDQCASRRDGADRCCPDKIRGRGRICGSDYEKNCIIPKGGKP